MSKIAKEEKSKKLAPEDKPVKVKKVRAKKKVKKNVPAIIDPQAIIMKAIDANLDIEKMERLLVMRKDINQETARKLYYENLSKFQKDCPVIKKEKSVYEKGSTTKVRYSYATIEHIIGQVKSLLEKYGFSYTFKTDIEIDKEKKAVLLSTKCISFHEAGHEEETIFMVPVDWSAYMSAPQKIASASTFSKRYAFCNAFGIVTENEDDDANIADVPKKPETIKKQEYNKAGKTELSDKHIDPEKILATAKRILATEIKGKRVFCAKDSLACLAGIKTLIADKKYSDAIAYIDLIKKQIPGGK